MMMLLSACVAGADDSNSVQTDNVDVSDNTASENTASENSEGADFKTTILYSNLVDDNTKKEVRDSLIASGIKESNVDLFLKAVTHYNNCVGDVGLVKKGFVTSDTPTPIYDVEKIYENWDKANGSFEAITGNRNNCRLTTFTIAGDLINIDGDYVKDNKMLFMDNDTILYSNTGLFTDKNIDRFNTFFGDISTDLVKDVDFHLQKVKNYWNDKKVSFSKSEVSIITIWFHDDLDNNLFVGHTGILVPDKKDNSLLFIEKISFEEPYQVLKFNNRVELNDYLMAKYDTEYERPTAKPFIMENGDLLEGYRKNPNNKK